MSGTRHWLDNLKLRASWGKLGNDGGDDSQNMNISLYMVLLIIHLVENKLVV